LSFLASPEPSFNSSVVYGDFDPAAEIGVSFTKLVHANESMSGDLNLY
jgi:hypothetical protein